MRTDLVVMTHPLLNHNLGFEHDLQIQGGQDDVPSSEAGVEG